jgi:hypothetical protein
MSDLDWSKLSFFLKPLSWTVCEHVCTKNASSVIGLSVLQVRWHKCTYVTSLVTTSAIYSCGGVAVQEGENVDVGVESQVLLHIGHDQIYLGISVAEE